MDYKNNSEEQVIQSPAMEQMADMPNGYGSPMGMIPPMQTPEDVKKGARKVFSSVGFRLFFGTLITIVVNLICQIVAFAIHPEWATDYTALMLVALIPQYLIGMPAMAFLLMGLPHKAPEKKKITFGWFIIFFIISYSLMLGSNYIGTFLSGIVTLLQGKTENTYAVKQIIMNGDLGITSIFTVVLAPIVEEFIFRKLVLDRCGSYGEAASALLSGVTFGLFHGNITQAIYAFCLGYFLALIYQKTGKVYVTIGIHLIINFMGSVVAMKVLGLIDLDALSNISIDDTQAILAYAQEHGLSVFVYGLYSMLIMGLFVAGIILLIVNRRKFLPAKGQIQLPRHSTFAVVVGNPGVICFIVLTLAWTVLNMGIF